MCLYWKLEKKMEQQLGKRARAAEEREQAAKDRRQAVEERRAVEERVKDIHTLLY